MKSTLSLLLVLFLLVFAEAAVGQAACATASCGGWGDINLLTGICDPSAPDAAADTSALQNAFCCLKSDGGTLVLPAKGICELEEELSLKNGSNFHIDGNGATLRNVAGSSIDSTIYGGIQIQESSDFSIRNLILDGNRANRPAPIEKPIHLVFLRGTQDVELENVRAINSVADGFYLRSHDPDASGQDLARVRLIGCSSDNSWRHGLGIASGEDIQVLGGTFANANGAITRGGVYFSGGIRIETNPYIPGEGGSGDEHDAISHVLIQGASLHDNEAMGIHVSQAVDQPVRDIRLLGNSLKSNVRGQMLLRGHRILAADNHLENFAYDSSISQVAGILVRDDARDVVLQGNTFSNFTLGSVDVVQVEANVEGFVATGNHFRDMLSEFEMTDTSASAPTVIRTEASDSVITDNTFRTSDFRGILVADTASRSTVSGNTLYGMTLNVIYVDGDDTVLSGNRIADPRGFASSALDESAVRVLSDQGTAEGNAIACASTLQTGFLFDQNPVIVADNVGKGCTDPSWLKVLGAGTTFQSGNYLYP